MVRVALLAGQGRLGTLVLTCSQGLGPVTPGVEGRFRAASGSLVTDPLSWRKGKGTTLGGSEGHLSPSSQAAAGRPGPAWKVHWLTWV